MICRTEIAMKHSTFFQKAVDTQHAGFTLMGPSLNSWLAQVLPSSVWVNCTCFSNSITYPLIHGCRGVCPSVDKERSAHTLHSSFSSSLVYMNNNSVHEWQCKPSP